MKMEVACAYSGLCVSLNYLTCLFFDTVDLAKTKVGVCACGRRKVLLGRLLKHIDATVFVCRFYLILFVLSRLCVQTQNGSTLS